MVSILQIELRIREEEKRENIEKSIKRMDDIKDKFFAWDKSWTDFVKKINALYDSIAKLNNNHVQIYKKISNLSKKDVLNSNDFEEQLALKNDAKDKINLNKEEEEEELINDNLNKLINFCIK